MKRNTHRMERDVDVGLGRGMGGEIVNRKDVCECDRLEDMGECTVEGFKEMGGGTGGGGTMGECRSTGECIG
jgi:hypothetical protein